jgi:hypothetical protein
MKTIINKFILIIACLLANQIASGQQDVPDTAGGLRVSAWAFFSPTVGPTKKLYVSIVLLNTTNHDITVLTKTGSSRYLNLSSDKTKYVFDFGFSSGTFEGHPIVPSLPELVPVTLKSNEVAFCHMVVEQNDQSKTLQGLTKDSPIVISYVVSSELGARFGCWSGQINTKPFHIE